MSRSLMFHIKLFIWNNFVMRFYKDWIEEEAQEIGHEREHEPIYYDLD